MCGIAGWFGEGKDINATSLVEALRHRGPDGSGVWQGANATLVHTRLAIIDLSEGGRQPMELRRSEVGDHRSLITDHSSPYSSSPHPDGDKSARPAVTSYLQPTTDNSSATSSTDHRSLITDHSSPHSSVLVFNGEIYNYRELRNELEQKGEVFTSDSDTEVLLRLLVREGAACLPRLAGMFAFAFWDEDSGTAILARDPLGIKPLYYRDEHGTLTFASESHVLQRQGDRTDATALRDFFLWGSVPEPATLCEAVRQIPAGHLLKWHNGRTDITGWYKKQSKDAGYLPPPTIRNPRSSIVDPQSATALTREALLESLRRHLVSDVPVGIFLSGGIDSTAILALARQVLGPQADLRTFSIGFDDPAFDESSLARQTAGHFGTQHTEWKMTLAEGASEIPACLEAIDQPSIDGFNTWCVAKLARREGMKVVLSGLGGDEWFAGYGSFRRVPQFRRLYRLLGPLRPLVARILEARQPGNPWRRLAAFLRGGGTWLEAYHAQRGIFTPAEADCLAEFLTGQSPSASVWQVPDLPDHPLAVVSELEITRYMRNQLLRDSDVFSMAHGLELRVPFVDVRLAETLLSITPALRLRHGKQLLLDAVPEIPDWVKNQPKRGFRFPFQHWMEGQFGELLAEAGRVSPIPLNGWYRIWAMAVALRNIQT